MRRFIFIFSIFFFVLSCKTNPFTGKKTLNFVDNSQLFPLSFQQYNKVLSESKVINGTPDAEMIKRVGQRIAVAADRWLTAMNQPGYLKDYRWDYKLLNEDQVNAWAMPGGKIAVYTGLLPITQTETGLAVVLGHEVAHALADHGAQRMSAAQLQQVGGLAVAVATSGKEPEKQQMWMQAYGLGTTLGGMLPFSRNHETEADLIGIQLMAIAGYDPYEAAELWKRMKAHSQQSGKQTPPEFLSTHPSSDTRIKNLTQWAPAAAAEAKKFGVSDFKK